jgi:glycosyltransferase involved in cell wall biosynthesis
MISVLFYCYNHEQYVLEGIENILNQQFDGPGELVVIDDHSTDNSSKVISDYLANLSNEVTGKWKITFVPHTLNVGQTRTLVSGLQMCAGDYIAICEGDDYWFRPDHLSKLKNSLEEYPFAAGAFSGWICFEDNARFVETREIGDHSEFWDANSLLWWNAPATLSACMYRGKFLRKILPKLGELHEVADFGLNLIISEQGPIVWTDNVSLYYRYVSSSMWRKLKNKERENREVEMLDAYSNVVSAPLQKLLQNRSKEIRLRSTLKKKLLFVIEHPDRAIPILMKKLFKRG